MPSILHPKVLESISNDLKILQNLHVSLSDTQSNSTYFPRGNSLDVAGLRIAISKCERLSKFTISINTQNNPVERIAVSSEDPNDSSSEQNHSESEIDDIPIVGHTNFRDFLDEQNDYLEYDDSFVAARDRANRGTQVVIERL